MLEPPNYADEPITCKPLDTYKELLSFVSNPPVWRSLCTDITPHSEYFIRNCEQSKNFSQLMLEAPLSYCHFNPDTVKDSVRYESGILPKTLVCHDMANGYHDDSVIDGTGSYEAYTFYNWTGIDIFCYFSHHLITVPPLGWINVGHAHGVKVIGTVITEWSDGVTFWSKVLSSEQETQRCISALVAVAKTLKFDGWLLNVENKIAEPEKLLEFVKRLHRSLHQELRDPVLIWYDSVTVDGQLEWQNKLNSKNKAFFDACDGFFTNYSWTATDLLESVAAAGARLTDLYIGIDVWGRNFFGGGKFNTQEAVKLVHSLGCSLAIFAPAWTHEAMSDEQGSTSIEHVDRLSKLDKFQLRDRALWDSLWPFLNTRLPSELPFKTSFCRGQGNMRFLYGEVLCPIPWYNLRHMQYQPNAAHGPHGYAILVKENTSKRASRTSSRGINIIHSDETIAQDQEKNEIESQNVNKMEFAQDSLKLIKCQQSVETNENQIKRLESVEMKENKIKRRESAEMKENKIEHRESVEIKENKIERRESGEIKENKIKSRESVEINENKIQRRESGEEKENKIIPTTSRSEHGHTVEENVNRKRNKSCKEIFDIVKDFFKKVSPSSSEVKSRSTKRSPKSSSRNSVVVEDFASPLSQGNVNAEEMKPRVHIAHVTDELECLEVYYRDSFTGGSCLKINPSDKSTIEHRTIRLFHCDFFCKDTLIICFVTKLLPESTNQYLNVHMYAVDESENELKVVLVGRNMPMRSRSSEVIKNEYPCPPSDSEFRDMQEYILLNQPEFYVPVENSFNWKVWYFQVALPNIRITSINLWTGEAHGAILLGHFGLCQRISSRHAAHQTE